MKIEIKNRDGDVIVSGEYSSFREACEHNKDKLEYVDLRDVYLRGANFIEATFYVCDYMKAGADFSCAILDYE